MHPLASFLRRSSTRSGFAPSKTRGFRRLLADRHGGSVVALALSLASVMGFTGLGAEATGWYMTKRAMQGAADTAAATAATALAAGQPGSTFAGAAKSVAAAYNYVDGSNGTTVAVNYPPQSGDYQSSPAVEVIIRQSQRPMFSGMFWSTGPVVQARAVALANTSKTGQACVVALDKNSETSVTTSGSPALSFPGCSLYVDSPSSSAVSLGGTSSISAAIAYVVGGVSGSGLTTVSGTFTGVNPLIDPYLNAAVPSYSGCDSNNYKQTGGGSDTKNAGASGIYVFCNGITLSGGSSLTLGAGTYIVDRGTISVGGGSSLIATAGTTLILTSSVAGKACANTKFDGGANISIDAPTSGALSGIALFLDRACTDTSASNSLTGGSTQNIVGAIYYPNEPISYSGGSPTGGAICTQLIAYTIDFSGNSTFNNTCSGTGVRSISLTGGRLVE